jgi:hypothetical protein
MVGQSDRCRFKTSHLVLFVMQFPLKKQARDIKQLRLQPSDSVIEDQVLCEISGLKPHRHLKAMDCIVALPGD